MTTFGKNNETHTPSAAAVAAATPAPARNRAGLIAFVPLALIAATCMASVAQRTVAAYQSPVGGGLDRREATRIAAAFCNQVAAGSPVQVQEATLQYAYSYKRQESVREWNVLCNTSIGQYLVRINARTGKVYAINKLRDGSPSPARFSSAPNGGAKMAKGASGGTENTTSLTRREAEQRAQYYLSLLGISPRDLEPVSDTGTSEVAPEQWNFTFRRTVPGMGKRLLKVSVGVKSGDLEDAWNPVYAL